MRFVGATAPDRSLARRLAADPRVDVLMHRFNMAHRKAAREVFPVAAKARTPIVAFTATRWGTLLRTPELKALGDDHQEHEVLIRDWLVSVVEGDERQLYFPPDDN